jgi:protein-tyrosine phosphatase
MTKILFVCTGNLCRSPSAAWFLSERVHTEGPAEVVIRSAGTRGASNGPPAKLVKEGAAIGMDLDGHVPRRMAVVDIQRADLVIGMAREHVRETVLMEEASFSKAFTLREFVRRGSEIGARALEEPLSEWLERMHGLRRHLDLIGDSGPDDIPDPMGGSSEDYRKMLNEVGALTDMLHSLIWGEETALT